jgi:hypothetical protein
LRHSTTTRFWRLYRELPAAVQRLADKHFELLKADSRHPSLHFKRIGELWSVRVGIHYRALAIDEEDGCVWSWIGSHDDYDHLLP